MLEQLHSADEVFKDKKVLIADDDVRNVFALASVLERHGMNVRFAENGNEALAVLAEDPTIDLVLMDIMMPELDGYETMEQIRAQAAFAKLPIISLTAKAMKGDREKSISVRRLRLHHQAGRHRPAALPDAGVAVPLSTPSELAEERLDLETIEIQLLLEGIYRQYGFDFREYAHASLRRRVWRRVRAEELDTISALTTACCTTAT